MSNPADLLRETRKILLSTCLGIRAARADAIPDAFRNNIRWNLGHCFTTTDIILFRLRNEGLTVPEAYRSWFSKGTSPADFTSETPTWEALVGEAERSIEAQIARLPANLDEPLPKAYQTSTGPLLTTLAEAVGFAAIHEAFHTGHIAALAKVTRNA